MSFDMLSHYVNWYGPDFLPFVKARMQHDGATAKQLTDKVVVRIRTNMKLAEAAAPKKLIFAKGKAGSLFTTSFCPILKPARGLRCRCCRFC